VHLNERDPLMMRPGGHKAGPGVGMRALKMVNSVEVPAVVRAAADVATNGSASLLVASVAQIRWVSERCCAVHASFSGLICRPVAAVRAAADVGGNDCTSLLAATMAQVRQAVARACSA
jgi:hypothetical protein